MSVLPYVLITDLSAWLGGVHQRRSCKVCDVISGPVLSLVTQL